MFSLTVRAPNGGSSSPRTKDHASMIPVRGNTADSGRGLWPRGCRYIKDDLAGTAGIYDSAHLIFHGPSVRRKISVN